MPHTSAGLGQLQGDGIREISASFYTRGQHGIGSASGGFGVIGGQSYDWKYGGSGNHYFFGGIDFYASRVTPVVGEVRPVNRAVHYLIRAHDLPNFSNHLIFKHKRDGKCANTYRPIARGLFRDSPSDKTHVFPLNSP